ncbi:hypothetical protein BH20ACT23_BH20ACT23_22750 [soil metagenome]
MTTLGACEPTTPDARSADRPNVLIIVTDDQPLGTMSAMPETARLLGDEGTRFVNAFAATPNCCPSRASIMTGQYAHNHGVTENSKALRLVQDNTLQRHLHDAGYFNATVGKFLNRWPIDQAPPYFDRWTTFSSTSNNAHYYSGGRWNVDGTVERIDEYATSFVERKTLEYLEAAADSNQPWFMYVAPTAPHSDLQQLARVETSHQEDPVERWHPEPSVGEGNRGDKPKFVRALDFEDDRGERSREAQLRSLMSVDELVAGVFERLNELGQERNTLVIYLSDNGYMWGQHGIVTKHFPYSESVRIPLFVRWPDQVEAGGVDRRLVSTVDIAPTVMDALGIPFGPGPDGRSLLDSDSRREALLLEHWRSRALSMPRWASVRAHSFQYIEYYRSRAVVGQEYYDLRSDPFQLRNLLGDDDDSNDPDLGRAIRLLADFRNCSGSSCP